MKVNRLETHDRLLHFQKQSTDISACCDELIKQRPFGDTPFYIFAHKRTLGHEERFNLFTSGKYESFDTVPFFTIIWQPRLTKPKAQTNSMLFKGYPGTDHVKVIWIIPPEELWGQYDGDKMTASHIVVESIYDYQHDRKKLEAPEPDDLSEEQIDAVYKKISQEARTKKSKTVLV